MADMFAEIVKARGALRAKKGHALDSYVTGGDREARLNREFGTTGPRRNPMSPEAIGTLSDDELRQKYSALRGSMGGGLFAGQGFAKKDDTGTPDGSPVGFVKGAAPEGDR